MSNKNYDSLVTELSSFIQKYKVLHETSRNAEFDLRWRLSELFKDVKEEDEQKFIDVSGLGGFIITSKEKREIEKKKKVIAENQDSVDQKISEYSHIIKKTNNEKWVKSLYKRSVRRCHPDTIKVADNDYKEKLSQIYKDITEAYEDDNLDILMVEAFKLFIKPKEVIKEQIEILEESKKMYYKKIKHITTGQGYAWSTFSEELKENFLINLMKQHGIRFVDRTKVKEVLRRKASKRKTGEKPKNKLRDRVKNNKLST